MKQISLTILTFLVFVSLTIAQNIAPKVSEINSNHRFVIVLQERGTLEAKVLMPDGTASEYAFNAEDLNTYPQWIINRITVNRGENVAPLYYTTYQSAETRNYLAFGNSGENKTISEEAYDKFYEKDDAGNYKYTIEDMYHCIYREYVAEDDKHIYLTYHDDRNGAGTVHIFRKGWPSKFMKLVLVKI